MQDIVFYVAANETLGRVRDYSNMRNSGAPLLTLGVAVCLRMRLFEDIEDSTPYPIASFSGITDWQWRMDADFDRSTACKLVADADGISVHTVTDTVKGETMSFTEFVIPISNMNTEGLVAWLGIDKVKTGLAGELVGYDNEGHATFVLQIEDFSVRNRLAGLNDEDEDDPTPVDQEIVTRPVAEQMIQTAVSTLDAAKQDKLTSANAGTGISISSAGVISAESVPQSAITNLSASLAAKQDKLTAENAGTGISVSSAGIITAENIPQSSITGLEAALSYKQNALSTGFGIEIDDDWINVARYYTIHGPYSSGSVTLQAGEAFKIYATNSAVTLNKGSIPNNTWGLEGHVEIFVANTGYVHTGSGVVLANALEPDAVNNCTVRFHDGLAIISVEDHVAGYIVTVNAGTTAGSLYYGLATSTNEYIAVDASLNGQTLDLGGVITSAGEKHVVGNGYDVTFISGGIICTSQTTLSNLTAAGVVVSSGTLTLGDVYIPNGATVSVSGGGLAIEKVTGAGGTIDLGGTCVNVPKNTSAYAGGCVFSGGSGDYGGAIYASSATLILNDVTISGCTGGRGAVMLMMTDNGYFTSCTLRSNNAYRGDLYILQGTGFIEGGCSIEKIKLDAGAVVFAGSNTVDIVDCYSTHSGTVTISGGATINLTSNIAPGGGIVVLDGGCMVNGASFGSSGGSTTYTSIVSAGGSASGTLAE